jgi:phage terminase large subunit-like protein
MSVPPTEREIQQQFTQAVQQVGDVVEGDDITVLWGAADPENRPDGVTWVPQTNTLTYDLWNAQRLALGAVESGKYDITGFLAGYGSGKTMLGARWIIKQAVENPGSRFLAMGQDYQKAEQSTFSKLFEQLPGERTHVVTSGYNGVENSPLVADYNRQRHRLTLTNDSVIVLGSADRWSRYAGTEFGGAWLDEPSLYGGDLHDLLEMIGSRLRGVDGPKRQLWTLTGNGQNAAFDILERTVDSSGEPLGLHVELVRASSLENPYLADETKEQYKRQYGDTSREKQALFGGFVAGGGNLLSTDQLQFISGDELTGEFRYHVGVDLSYVESKAKAKQSGSDHTAAVLVAHAPSDGTAYVLDIVRTRGGDLREKVQWLAALANKLPNPTVKVEGTAGQVFFAQEARNTVPGTVQTVNPSESKEKRITDMSILFSRGDIQLANKDIDDALGYDDRFRPFVREWSQFGATNDSPDILDACYCAVHDLNLGEQQETQILSGPFGNRNRERW